MILKKVPRAIAEEWHAEFGYTWLKLALHDTEKGPEGRL